MSNHPVYDALPVHVHLLQVYSEDVQVLAQMGRFIVEAVDQGEGVVVAARRERWGCVATQLQAAGLHTDVLVAQGRLVVMDAEDLADRILFEGASVSTCSALVQPLLAQVRDAAGNPQARLFGEVADVLWARGEPRAAQEFEGALNRLVDHEALSLLCACRLDAFDTGLPEPALTSLLESHHHVIGSDEAGRRMVALERAIEEVLGPGRTHMVRVVSASRLADKRRPPSVEGMVAWLREHMPHHAVDVLRLAHRYATIAA